ncbi:MAG: prolipoprotein diacylglyceryl transferase [Rhodospirillaceae bacterium]|nr:prolipoprotein diacylglyceryl transferase [Rhodospirillaceae bacterium]
MLAIPFPVIDPVAISIGPVDIRWYALAYLVGFILGWRYCIRVARRSTLRPTGEEMDEFLTWAVIAVIVGGRLGFVLFYQPSYYLSHPLQILQVWEGGMSFHGGLIGVALAEILFAWRRKLHVLSLADVVAAAVPIGLFFGRIANFINGELWGRPSDLPWAMVFSHPQAGDLPRHPSQLYEAFFEGLVLFLVLYPMVRSPALRRRPGIVAGTFLIGYGIFRFLAEFVRQPDAGLETLPLGMTMGQWLSMPMMLVGAGFIAWALTHAPLAPSGASPKAGRTAGA